MSRHLGDIAFPDLLPESIRNDAQFAAVAEAVDGLIRRTVTAIPNLLLWARLDRENTDYLPPLARLIEAAGGLKPLSPELLEMLAWQLHVDFREAATTREQLEGMIRNSIPWHRIKGTPASIKAALKLFGFDNVIIEEDGEGDAWATYQIGLPQIADLATVQLVCRVADEMQPARCRLYRLYTGVWDTRPGNYSGGFKDAPGKDGGFYSEAAYSFYSGVPTPGLPDGGDVLVSFGTLRGAATMPVLDALLPVGMARLRSIVALMGDSMGYSDARYSDTLAVPNHGFVRFRLRSRMFAFDRPAAGFASRASIRAMQSGTVLMQSTVTGRIRLVGNTTDPVMRLIARWTGRWDERRWRAAGGAFTNIIHHEA